MQTSAAATQIVCDMTDASDTPTERLAEYERLFSAALLGRTRTRDGVRFRFRGDEGIETWVQDLAAREKACCAFFTFTVTRTDREVHWVASVVDDDIARAILEEFYALPDAVAAGGEALEDRLSRRGLRVHEAE